VPKKANFLMAANLNDPLAEDELTKRVAGTVATGGQCYGLKKKSAMQF
jgi:hypothetical protein